MGRYFKPDNVLVGVDGRARVVDFGLVTAPPRAGDAGHPAAPGLDLTAVRGLLGTPAYMSPEQFAGRTADARSDQFSYCVAIYEAVCGVRPFPGEGIDALRAAVVAGAMRAPPPELPPWLWALLRRGLARDPADRFAAMDDLLASLARDPAELRRRRRRIAGLVTLSAVAAVLAAVLVQDVRHRWRERSREQAAAHALTAIEARVAEARAAGDPAAADRMFAAWVEDPLHDGTAALARAWLGEAARREIDGAADSARTAFVTAYLAAPSEALQADALVGLVRHFHGGLQSDEFAQAFALLDRTHPDVARSPAFAALQVDAALARRDLAGARALVGESPAHRLVDALAGATATAHHDIDQVAVNAAHVLLVEHSQARWTLHLATRDSALTPVRSLTLPADIDTVKVFATDPFHVIVHPGSDLNVLHRVDASGLTELHSYVGDVPHAVGAADLDRDGSDELYVGTGTDLEILAITRGADGAWSHEVVYTAADSLQSAVSGLAAIDLDGDGRDELAASFNGWRAFDVRVLRRDPGASHLRTVARDKLGNAFGLFGLRTAEGPLLVANILHHGEAPLVFPPDHPAGAPAGLYLYGFDGARLQRRGHIAAPVAIGQVAPAAGDVDGDGREDLVTRRQDTDRRHTVLYLRDDDGGSTPVLIGHLGFLGLAQLDDDPQQELIAWLPDAEAGSAVWVVGAGSDELPPLARSPSRATPIVDAEDPTWTRQSEQAAALADLGLHADAAAAFRGLAVRAASPELRGRAFLRAAGLHERAGQHAEARDLHGTAALEPAVAAEALPGLLRAQLRLGEYDRAGATLAAVQALPDLDLDVRAELTRRHGRLPGVIAERVDLDFRQPLAPGWELVDPLALRREHDGLALATNAPGVLMSLPVTWSGDLLELDVDLTLLTSEWSADLEIGLVAEGELASDALHGEAIVAVDASSSGTRRGGVTIMRGYTCRVGRQVLRDESSLVALARKDPPGRLEMRVAWTPALGEAGCEIREHGVTGGRPNLRRNLALPPAGPLRLVVRLRRAAPAWLEARLHSITLRGVTLRDVPPADPARAELARALVARQSAEVLAAIADLPSLSPRERAWQADALLQLGRLREAEVVWSGLLAIDPLEPTLAARLRAEPAVYGPHLSALDPAGHSARLVAVWANAAANHLGDPRAREAMAGALVAVDASLAATRDPADRGHLATLLGWRARLWMHAGEAARARADFEAALGLLATLGPDASQRADAWLSWIELATLAAAEGDLVRAREAVRQARDSSELSLLVDDVLRARPPLAALAEPASPE